MRFWYTEIARSGAEPVRINDYRSQNEVDAMRYAKENAAKCNGTIVVHEQREGPDFRIGYTDANPFAAWDRARAD